jgi:hypothetical protein
VGRDGESYSSDLGFGKTEIFLQKGLDRPQLQGRTDLPVGPNQSRGYHLNSIDAGFCLHRKWLTHGRMVCSAGNFRFLSASSIK